jgi:ABC-type multidrug transport system ATPase subunit
VERIESEIKSVIESAKVKSAVAGEVIFQLPLNTSPLFAAMFSKLQQQATQLGIGSYGISLTTLEQVFITLAHAKIESQSTNQQGGSNTSNEEIDPELDELPDDFNSRFRKLTTICYEYAQSSVTSIWRWLTGPSSAVRGRSITPELVPPEVGVGNEGQDTTSPSDAEQAYSKVPQQDDGKVGNTAEAATVQATQQSIIGVSGIEDGISQQSFWIQCLELYRKRLIVASRDLKGFFFQIMFPSVQILLIMLILTVNVNPAGRTIIFNGDLFDRYGQVYPTVVVSEGTNNIAPSTIPGVNFDINDLLENVNISLPNIAAFNDSLTSTSAFISQLNGEFLIDNVTTFHPMVTNSTALSNYLLDLNQFELNRLGGYSFDDTIPLNITVNWDWVQKTFVDAKNSNDTAFLNFPPISTILRDVVFVIVGENYTISFTDLNEFSNTVLGMNVTDVVVSLIETNVIGDITAITVANSSEITIDLTPLLENAENLDVNTTEIVDFIEESVIAQLEEIFNVSIVVNTTSLVNTIANFNATNGFDNNNIIVITIPGVDLNDFNLTNIFENNNGNALSEFLISTIDNDQSNVKVTQSGLLVTIIFQDNSILANQDQSFLISWTTLSNDFLFTYLLPTSGETQTTIPIFSPYTILHNTSSPHAMNAWYGELVESAFQKCVVDSTSKVGSNSVNADGTPSIRYLTKNHPLPITTQQSIEIRIILSLLTSIFILVPLCYIPAAFIAFLVKERVSKSKHLQIVSGISPYLYWIATYSWDISLFLILIAFIFIALAIFGQNAAKVFIGDSISSLCLFCLLITYGMSCVPLCYLYSFGFTNFSTAQIAIMVINFMTGFVMVLAYYIMISVPDTQAAAKVLVHVFRFFPPYNIGEGLINMSTAYYQIHVLQLDISYFDWKVTGRNIVFMFVQAIGYFGIVLLTESAILRLFTRRCLLFMYRGIFDQPPPRKSEIDSDVKQEEEHVNELLTRRQLHNRSNTSSVAVPSAPPSNAGVIVAAALENQENEEQRKIGQPDNEKTSSNSQVEHYQPIKNNEPVDNEDQESHETPYALIIDSLIKTYPAMDFKQGKPKYAVRGMSLACPEGERFGLLGINGAGKTTTLGVLTNEIFPTSGEVYIGGKPLSDPSTQQMLGYCPQVDPLLDLMNAYETLWFFGRIRGIKPDILQARVEALIEQTGLRPHAHRPCGTYSGGNKRKLSLAVALIGDPKVLLLDEVSARYAMIWIVLLISNNDYFFSHSLFLCVFLQPSTGMDPEARRHMWNVIQQVSSNRTVILVSHLMEEIEALCTRVGVMVSGRLQCLGSVQHLKGKFGGGYEVEVRCHVSKVEECLALCREHLVPAVDTEIEGSSSRANSVTLLPLSITVLESHGGYFRLRLPASVDIASVFAFFEEHRHSDIAISEYSITECSLEQVFMTAVCNSLDPEEVIAVGGDSNSSKKSAVIGDAIDVDHDGMGKKVQGKSSSVDRDSHFGLGKGFRRKSSFMMPPSHPNSLEEEKERVDYESSIVLEQQKSPFQH